MAILIPVAGSIPSYLGRTSRKVKSIFNGGVLRMGRGSLTAWGKNRLTSRTKIQIFTDKAAVLLPRLSTGAARITATKAPYSCFKEHLSKLTSSSCFCCPTKSPKHKDSSLTVKHGKEKQQIHSLKKLEPGIVWHFCLKKWWKRAKM